MSIDTAELSVTGLPETHLHRQTARRVFGKSAKGGRVYRWGLAAAGQGQIQPLVDNLSRLAVNKSSRKVQASHIDWQMAVESLAEWLDDAAHFSPADCSVIVTWAAALPRLVEHLGASCVDGIRQDLLELRQEIQRQHQVSSPAHLMLIAELGLTLAWRHDKLPNVNDLADSSWRAFNQWSNAIDDSVSAALEQATQTRVVLASLIRCQRLAHSLLKQELTKSQCEMGRRLASWVTAMTTRTGTTAFSKASEMHVADDLGPHGLLVAATAFDRESLTDALVGALGAAPKSGRLAWQALLPKTFHHDFNAKKAVMFADWDVGRGRTHVDYSGDQVELEIWTGKRPVIRGRWEVKIATEKGPASAAGPWNELCEFSDDDVHYLEIEQPWTNGLLLQRQFMLIRDDRCLLVADSVVADPKKAFAESISYQSSLVIVPEMRGIREKETQELFIGDRLRRVMVLPLAANEWKVGATNAIVNIAEDQSILASTSGGRAVYMPLWFDFRRLRFKRMRTWRKLTVADQLRIVDHDEAACYRVQVGSEQWVIYRSLIGQACRSFLGKHLIADFFCSRFDPEDGGHEELVTVDDDEAKS